MAHTTERATLVLYANPSLVETVQATTANVELNDENRATLKSARRLLERFPIDVQHAAAKRREVHRVIVSRRLAIIASVRAAQKKKYGKGRQAEPVSPLLEALGDAPGDILRVIVEFVGEEVEETWERKFARIWRRLWRRLWRSRS